MWRDLRAALGVAFDSFFAELQHRENERLDIEDEIQGERMYAGLEPDSIVHYHDRYGCFVRCVVTKERDLRPIELLGSWQDWDIHRPTAYWPDKIRNGRVLHPHWKNVVEFNDRLVGELCAYNFQVWPKQQHRDVLRRALAKALELATLVRNGQGDSPAAHALRDEMDVHVGYCAPGHHPEERLSPDEAAYVQRRVEKLLKGRA